jgi:PAS domain S-box-containing protein
MELFMWKERVLQARTGLKRVVCKLLPDVSGEEAHRAHLLLAAGLIMATVGTLFLVMQLAAFAFPAVPPAPPTDILMDVAAMLIGGLTVWLVQAGRIRPAAWVVLGCLLVMAVAQLYLEGHPPADMTGALALFIIVALAMILLDRHSAWLAFVVAAATFVGVHVLWLGGHLPQPIVRDLSDQVLFSIISWLACAGILVAVVNSTMAVLRDQAKTLQQRVVAQRQVEEALRASEEMYRLHFEKASDVIYSIDPEFRLLSVSPSVERLLGYKPEDLIGKWFQELNILAPEYLEAAYSDAMHVLEGREVASSVYEFIAKDGTRRFGEVSGTPLIRDGEIVAVTSIARDITARKQAEERMHRSLDQQIAVNQLALALGETRDLDRIYHTIYEHIRAMVDAWGFIVSFYDDETQLIQAGYAMHQGVNVDVTAFLSIPLAEPGQGTQSQVIHTGEPLYTPDHRKALETSQTEYTVEEDGTISKGPPEEGQEDSTKSVLYVPMKIEGKPIGVMQLQSPRLDAYTQEDIDLLAAMANVAAVAFQNARLYKEVERELAERKRSEEALRESEERYRSTLDAMLEGCQIIGYDWRYLYVNDTAAGHGRKTKDQLLGRTMMEEYPGIESSEMFPFLRRCMEERIPHRMENEFTFPDGDKGWFELLIQPVAEGIFVLSLDITERKQAEEELKQHREHLEELVRERTAELHRAVNLMAGREVRMAELKEVIRQLHAQLEEAGLEPVADDPLLGGGA